MQCSHASSLKLIDWLVRCHGQAGEAGRAREAERWREGYGYCWMEDETYICVCWGAEMCAHTHTPTHTHTSAHTLTHMHTQLASSGLVLVSCPWPRRAQESAVSLWRIDTDTPHPSAPRHSQTSTSIPQSLQPLYLPPPHHQEPAYAWWACLRGDVLGWGWRRVGASLHLDCGLY